MKYSTMDVTELNAIYANEKKKYELIVKEKLNLDMSRGKPCANQLDLVMPLLDAVNSDTKFPKGIDYRNYGLLDGIPELKNLFGELLNLPASNIVIGGNSSLNLMYDMITNGMLVGVLGATPWCKLKENIKFICPVPGYDRHFNICEKLGIEMIAVPMDENGPDMDIVEELVSTDPLIKGIWCVPRFSNPSGIVYSDNVVKRLAQMKVAAPDFRIYYDNAYFVHTISDDAPKLLNIFEVAKEAGTEDRIYMFSSTSKITFAGSGVSFICASAKNIAAIINLLSWRIISYNKVWQYAHYLYLKNPENVKLLMEAQAVLTRPKFTIILDALKEAFGDSDLITWTEPKGGYFICVKSMNGTAKKIVNLCKKAGLVLTPAGASHPLHQDDLDSYLRIAPTFPSIDELKVATDIMINCIKIAVIEKLKGDVE